MTREEAKRRAELYSALAEGKIIQFKQENGEWVDLKMDLMCGIAESFRYRIKPEQKYRPFKSKEECWNEMLKHQPFGWIRDNIKYHFTLDDVGIWLSDKVSYTFRESIDNFTFADGTPFGIKEE